MRQKLKLREARKKEGYTQKGLARVTGISRNLISRLENNKIVVDKRLKRIMEYSLEEPISFPRRNNGNKKQSKQDTKKVSTAKVENYAPVADQIIELLVYFMNECESTINLDNYNKDFSVRNETLIRLLHNFWFIKLDHKTSRLDCDGNPYNHIRHVILPDYGMSQERKWDDNLWLSFMNIYSDKSLMHRMFNVNTKEYWYKISCRPDCISLSKIRDRINIHVKDIIDRYGGSMRQQQMENLLRIQLRYYIDAAEAIKND